MNACSYMIEEISAGIVNLKYNVNEKDYKTVVKSMFKCEIFIYLLYTY